MLESYLKLRPIHRHIDSKSVGPPTKVFLVVCIVHRMIKFFIDLRQPEERKLFFSLGGLTLIKKFFYLLWMF